MAAFLKQFTPARVGMGRSGNSLPTGEQLRLQLDHARARDAVYEALDPSSLGREHILLRTQAADRATYLRRPDLGRKLDDTSRGLLPRGEYDAAIVVADGLSATAVHRHAAGLLDALLPLLADWNLAPLAVVLQGRVAVADEIGQLLGARQVAILIGERPGLTSPDSLGVYLTYGPRPGRTDAERNCISNIRTEGLSYFAAARHLHFLMQEARTHKLTGVKVGQALSPAQVRELKSLL